MWIVNRVLEACSEILFLWLCNRAKWSTNHHFEERDINGILMGHLCNINGILMGYCWDIVGILWGINGIFDHHQIIINLSGFGTGSEEQPRNM
jgi:hypothetical protein